MRPTSDTAEEAEVIIDLGRHNTRAAVVGGLVSLVVGLAAITGAVLPSQADHGAGGRAVAAIIGAAFLLLPVLVVRRWRVASRPRRLIIGRAGVRYRDPNGASLSVTWAELDAVALSRSARAPSQLVYTPVVRLDVTPREPAFRARNPGMEPLWRSEGQFGSYQVLLGAGRRLLGSVDGALATFGGTRYRGTVARIVHLRLR